MTCQRCLDHLTYWTDNPDPDQRVLHVDGVYVLVQCDRDEHLVPCSQGHEYVSYLSYRDADIDLSNLDDLAEWAWTQGAQFARMLACKCCDDDGMTLPRVPVTS